jgi:hypothetical protein
MQRLIEKYWKKAAAYGILAGMLYATSPGLLVFVIIVILFVWAVGVVA